MFPERAPKWFRFKCETEEKVKKAMEENEQLCLKVEKLKVKRKKEKKENSEDKKGEDWLVRRVSECGGSFYA